MIEIIYALAAVVIFLWAFLTGAMFVNIKPYTTRNVILMAKTCVIYTVSMAEL